MKQARWALIMAGVFWALAGGLAPSVAQAQVALDSDLTPGYQGGSIAGSGETVTFEVIGKGLTDASGYSATLTYDDAQLTFEKFTATDLIPDFTGLTLRETGSVEIGGGSLSGVAGADQGRLGTVTFRLVDGFSGTASVSLGAASLLTAAGSEEVDGSGTIVVGGAPEDVIVLDSGLGAGYQGGRVVDPVVVGEDVVLELYGTSLTGANGYSATLQFDATQLELRKFLDGGLIPGFTGLIDSEDAGMVQVGGGSISGTADSASGRLGTVTFRVLPGFSGETAVTLLGGVVSTEGSQTDVTSSTTVAMVGEPVEKSADFSGDGRVDFSDFLVFAGGFGKSAGQAGYDARLDLSGNGKVDFEDFLLFAAEFGK